jgi:uncharacterized membrane protein
MGEPFHPQPELVTGALRTAQSADSRRLPSIDLVRGLVMVIMALDHVRDFWHHDSIVAKDPSSALGMDPINPVNLDETNGLLFLTRWITHFCVPTFVFLAGTGAFLYGARGRSRAGLAWFLLSRGTWLMLVDLTLVRLGWAFNFDYRTDVNGEMVWALGGGIIWVIGAGMVLMSALVFLPTSAIAVIGIAIIAFHNLLDGPGANPLHLQQWFWGILHDPSGGEVVSGVTFGTGYGLLPCLGIMAAGFAFGTFYLLDATQRRRQLLGLGLAICALFILLRLGNVYGDPVSDDPATPGPWSVRGSWEFTFYSFLNCQKYPPSLLYTLMLLGPAITLLGLLECLPASSVSSPGALRSADSASRLNGPVARFFVTFGRVPLFYYLLHLPLIHGLAVGVDYLRFGWSPLSADGGWSVARSDPPANYGVSLAVVYLVWIVVVLLLFPLCYWFAGIKQRYRWAWLSYL